MIKFYMIDSTSHIAMTCDEEYAPSGAQSFDFPEEFNFSDQGYWKIVGGSLVEDTAKRAADEAARQAAQNASTIADLEDIICELDERLASLEG